MAIREIVKIGDDILRQRSKTVTVFDDQLRKLIDDMIETMQSKNGAGLASVQVGIPKRIAICDAGEGILEMINPQFMEKEGEECMEEGCLSIPNIHASVKRPARLKIKAFDRYGKEFEFEAKGFMARAICHEIDHMDGILFLDVAEKA